MCLILRSRKKKIGLSAFAFAGNCKQEFWSQLFDDVDEMIKSRWILFLRDEYTHFSPSDQAEASEFLNKRIF